MKLRAAVCVSIWGMGLAAPALADEVPERKPAKTEYSAELLAGYGAGGQVEYNTNNHYGAGFGVRGGLTLAAPRLYFGLSFVHFAGYETNWEEGFTNTLDSEFGYEFRLLQDRLLIRPQLALGAAQQATIQPDNGGYPLAFHWAPGVLVGVRFVHLLVTAEYRRDMLPESGQSANTALFGLGLIL